MKRSLEVTIPDWAYDQIKKIAEKEGITGDMKVRQILARQRMRKPSDHDSVMWAEREKTK